MQNPLSKNDASPATRSPAIDWNLPEVLERVEGDREFLRELLTIFREDSRACMEKARAALAAGDLADLSRTAHTLKGMMKNLAMGHGAEIAANLEITARDGRKIDCKNLLARLDEAISAVLREIDVQLAEVQT